MGIVKNIFTWWEGSTFGTWLHTVRNGSKVGEDRFGNIYYEGGKGIDGAPRRWVMFNGSNDASRVPAEWHSWLHRTIDGTPESNLPAPRSWEADYTPNLTGTDAAYRPAGALESGGRRAMATGDYEAWSPDAS